MGMVRKHRVGNEVDSVLYVSQCWECGWKLEWKDVMEVGEQWMDGFRDQNCVDGGIAEKDIDDVRVGDFFLRFSVGQKGRNRPVS